MACPYCYSDGRALDIDIGRNRLHELNWAIFSSIFLPYYGMKWDGTVACIGSFIHPSFHLLVLCVTFITATATAG